MEYTTDYFADKLMDYRRTPMRGKRHKKPSSSTYMIITVWKIATIFFSLTSSTQSFSIFTTFFISHMPKPRFLNGLLNTFFLPLTFAKKQLFWAFLTSVGIGRSSKMTPRQRLQTDKLNFMTCFSNVDGKHLKLIKVIDIQQWLPIVHCGNSILGGGQ